MKIGILEIMPIGHYTLVDSIARIYLADKENEIYIFTLPNGSDILAPMAKEMEGRVKIVSKSPEETIDEFLIKLNSYKLSRVYIVTLDRYFKEILKLKTNIPLVLFIHNIEDWFKLDLGALFYRFFKGLKFSNIIYKIKVCFINPIWKKRLIDKILNNQGRLAVLNSFIKDELSNFIESKNIEIIPFSIFNPKLCDLSVDNTLIRICIPGMVDSVRRDYLSILKIFEEEQQLFKDKLELEFLGGIAYSNGGDKILNYADKLIKQGLKIIYYRKNYIPLDEFDEKLSRANIILGNMNVVINKYSSYGKTKESGIAYTMIRAGKPGILPSQYPLMKEVNSSTYTFNSYEELKSILIEIANNRNLIEKLTIEAKKNSLYFTPENLLKTIQ